MGTIIAHKKKGPLGAQKRAACRPPVPRAGRGGGGRNAPLNAKRPRRAFGDAGALGAAQRFGKVWALDPRGPGDVEVVPRGSAD